MKKVIVFDFDGVIIDSSKEAYKLLKKAYPEITQTQFEGLFNGNIFSELQKFGQPQIAIEELQKEWRGIISLQSVKPKVVDGMQSVLERLSKDFTLVVNTASEKETTQQFLLENKLDYFEAVYGAETSRSKVEKFMIIFSNHTCTAQECIFITDTIGDVAEASQVGVPTILVSWGYQSPELFSGLNPEVIGIANKTEELVSLLESSLK